MSAPETDATRLTQQRRLLVVDDERDILESLRDLLEASFPDIAVDTAMSGDEAIQRLKSSRYAAIISDYKMPGMDGLEFLREAREIAPSTPRVMMTAFPDLQIAIQAINDVSIENFFTKPLDPDEVIRVVGIMMDASVSSQQRNRAFARAMDLLRQRTAGESA